MRGIWAPATCDACRENPDQSKMSLELLSSSRESISEGGPIGRLLKNRIEDAGHASDQLLGFEWLVNHEYALYKSFLAGCAGCIQNRHVRIQLQYTLRQFETAHLRDIHVHNYQIDYQTVVFKQL